MTYFVLLSRMPAQSNSPEQFNLFKTPKRIINFPYWIELITIELWANSNIRINCSSNYFFFLAEWLHMYWFWQKLWNLGFLSPGALFFVLAWRGYFFNSEVIPNNVYVSLSTLRWFDIDYETNVWMHKSAQTIFLLDGSSRPP